MTEETSVMVFDQWSSPFKNVVNGEIKWFRQRNAYLKNTVTGRKVYHSTEQEEIILPTPTTGKTVTIGTGSAIGAGIIPTSLIPSSTFPLVNPSVTIKSPTNPNFTGKEGRLIEKDNTGLAFFPAGGTDVGSAVLMDNTPEEIGRGNLLTFGAASEFQELEAILVLVLAKKFMDTKEGQANLTSIINTYIKGCVNVIESLNHSGTQNYVNNIVNQYVSLGVFERLGFISAKDAFTTKVYLDHIVHIFFEKDVFGISIDAVTTMVNSSSKSERGSGMYAENRSVEGLLALLGRGQ